ncbi:BlaI/MecI/CopY family transcriptional regulator [Pedobacter sp. KACC 23697]|uniref:BlaI/MecI/CopY family transcriptional regulator n=1 Tax=Pedobacter sp. KACC 23697 TaxID=3149230 RepID=A0AAU7K9P6_9SPHI
MKNKGELASFVPTKTELNVLEILWKYGPSTVRFIHDKLNEQKEAVIYTSTLKLMQVMKEKGVLDRDESQMKHIYHAVLKEEKVKGNLLLRFVDQFYQGSPSKMMVSLLGTDKTSAEELQQMRDMINNTNLKK